jgi:hypothetical protein
MVKYHPYSKRGRIVKVLKEAGEPLTAFQISNRILEKWPGTHWHICSNGVSGLCKGVNGIQRIKEGNRSLEWKWVG